MVLPGLLQNPLTDGLLQPVAPEALEGNFLPAVETAFQLAVRRHPEAAALGAEGVAQRGDKAQAKLVRCIKGAVLDVAVDLRPSSAAYKKWVAVELSAENKRQLLIPRGFGHGFLTLTDDVEFLYKADNFYAPEADGGIRWDDPDLGVDWGVEAPILSEKDSRSSYLKDAVTGFEEW